MQPEWRRLIEAIHAAPQQCVMVVTGGGSSAIAELLVVPGGSRTVLEGAVPYSAAALTAWLGRQPEHYCHEETALAMATVAYERACRFVSAESPGARSDVSSIATNGPVPRSTRSLVGIACAAALVSDRPKRGDHRCHIALQTADSTTSVALTLQKGSRDREGEEQLVGRLLLTSLARSVGIDEIPPLELRGQESVAVMHADADPLLTELRSGERHLVWSLPGGGLRAPSADRLEEGRTDAPSPRGVLCGAFHPLHFGHQELRRVAQDLLGGPVFYELSMRNVDKPPLDYLSINRRRAQFTEEPLALTSAPTFAEKSMALPGVVFVVGVDTAERLIEPRYYGGSVEAMRAALAVIRDRGCRFLVAGRAAAGTFQTLGDLHLPAGFTELFEAIPPDAFRADVSSTELRARKDTSV